MKKNIALICGGTDGERDVSLTGCAYVKDLVDRDKYSVLEIEIEKDGTWRLSSEDGFPTFPVRLGGKRGFLVKGEILPVDAAAFPLLHGKRGEDGTVQGALDCAGISYVGAKTACSVICYDKIQTKRLAASLGIPVAKWLAVPKELPLGEAQKRAEKNLGYPMFLKPAESGSSIGAGCAKDRSAFADAFFRAAQSAERNVLIEEEISEKREIEVGYFSALGKTIISRCGEILTDGFYSYEEKYRPASRARAEARAELAPSDALLIKRYARELINAANARHLSRIDFFLSNGRIVFNEINTMPGFTPTSLYARMMESEGVSPSRLINSLIEDACREGER